MGGHLGDDVHEGGPVYAKGLDPLFIIEGTQDNPLPLPTADGMDPELMYNDLVIVPEHPGLTYLVASLATSKSVAQDTWQVQGVVADPLWDGWLLA